MKHAALLFLAAMTAIVLRAAEPFVLFHPLPDALPLAGATVAFDQREHTCVTRAVESLKADMARVGLKSDNGTGETAVTILVGTVGANPQIDQWVRRGELKGLKGCTEKYIIKTIGDQLVIAGSDKRGTVYGIYELSRQLGVSPWYWWADVPVEQHAEAFVMRGEYTDGEPAVRYRGIFLNDEAPCLTSWVKNTWGTNYGDHRFYERVFELLLRLKGNFLWPAMWSWAFYADDPLNSKTADEMGIIISTSHHEPMARNHQEWARHRREYGAWNYQTNKDVLDRFFREGIERMKGTDDVVTIGMRGDGDEAMSADADTHLLQQIVDNQRRIIKEVTGRPAKETPQVWALYKEVLDYYDKGMRVPDDVIMLLCDDNWGNVRRVPQNDSHKGGWGLYYHVDYVGAPRNSKWLNVTPSQNMWEQLTLAYQYGIDKLWVLNVGDLKPMEYPIQLFLDMAWNPQTVQADVVATHTEQFCAAQFGEGQAREAARILNLACMYAGRCTAEMLDAKTYNLETGEWRQVADEYMRLEAEALRQYLTLKPEQRDAYQQIILFPIQAMSNLHQMYYAQAMNLRLAQMGSPEANVWAGRVAEAFRRDSLLCASYNNDIAGGKWRGMMIQKHIGYTTWNDNFRADRMPRTQLVDNATPGGYTFTMGNGSLSIEAEHFYEAKAAERTEWTVIPFMGRTQSAVALMPYTEKPDGASLVYRWSGPDADSFKVHIVTKSTLDFLNKGGLCFRVSIDGGKAQTVNFNKDLNEQPQNIYSKYYPTVARRVVESVVTLEAGSSTDGIHTLCIEPLDPAIVFEKIVIEGSVPLPSTYLFGNEPLTGNKKQ